MATIIKTAFKPPNELFVIRRGRDPVTWFIKEKPTMVTFKSSNHALMVASLIESHYRSNKEWPITPEFSYAKEVIPTLLDISQVDYKESKEICGLWNVNLLVIEDIEHGKSNKLKFIGEVESFSVEQDRYLDFLEYLYIN